MFQGAFSAQMRSHLVETVKSWPVDTVWNGCSGNFTIARMLPHLKHHGNDVTIYSSALGWWAAGEPVPVTLKATSADELDWLVPYLDTPTRTVATLMLGTTFLASVGQSNLYHRRQVRAYQGQFPALHARTVATLEKSPLQLASFACKDVLDWVREDVPADGPFVSFPPFFTGGYENMWAPLERHFDWPAPTYQVMGPDQKRQLYAAIVDRPHWYLGVNEEQPELAEFLSGKVQSAVNSLPVYLYSSTGPVRASRPHQTARPIMHPRLTSADKLTGAERVTLATIPKDQFSWLRSQHLDPKINVVDPHWTYAVLLDGKIAGCLGFKNPTMGFDLHAAYIMSDFPMAPIRYKRMASFVAMCAQSTEIQQLLERELSIAVRRVVTTAFTDNQVSMKYRTAGLHVTSRNPDKSGAHKYQIGYGAPSGRWSLQDAYTEWFGKHSRHQETA